MATPPDLTRRLTVGLAEHLHAHWLGTWSPVGVFLKGATGITTKAVPPQPDRIIALTPYTVADTVEGHRVQGMQVRTRGAQYDPLDVDDLDDAIYQLLHGAEGLVLGGVKVHKAYRASHGTLGADGDHRTEASANYYLLLDAPTAHTR
ncbi:minor capsid protein [Ornithinimicrobium sufpigmenti]|uniref:minor capsid protein n=1 Tax=Ornithinimicrobium sufpigmenti TaxID=2508882 RepID=UPI0010360D4A|nr:MULTISPECIES: minor capsid protein [unclassified Ornithinimicrobium]